MADDFDTYIMRDVKIRHITRPKEFKDGKEGVTVIYQRYDRQIVQHVYFDYNDLSHEEVLEEMARGKYVLEKIGSIFLDRETMVEIALKSEDLVDYVYNLTRELNKTNYKRTRLILKGYLNYYRTFKVYRSGDFIKIQTDEDRMGTGSDEPF